MTYGHALRRLSKLTPAGAPVPARLRVVSYDKKRETAGEYLVIEQAHIPPREERRGSVKPKAQNHYLNGTRNVLDLQTGKTTKIHVRLIESVDGERVDE